mgnify:CR=1 FL=1
MFGRFSIGSSGSATFTGNTRLNESIVTNAGFNNLGTVTNNGTLQLANAQTIYGYLNQAAGSTLDLMFAGNIVGWGGPWSYTFTGTRQDNLSLFQEQMNDAVAANGGEPLMNMTPAELRVAINKYMDQGVDFVKYGKAAFISSFALVAIGVAVVVYKGDKIYGLAPSGSVVVGVLAYSA